VAQPVTSHPVGTRFERRYLRQYDQTPDETQQPTTLGITALVQAPAPVAPLDQEKKKEVRFDKTLKKNPSQGHNTPFRFDILAQLVNIPACITLHELLRLLKETREALRDALTDSESFLNKFRQSLLTWMWLEFWKETAHPFAAFPAERKANQLLRSNTQGVGICHSIHAV